MKNKTFATDNEIEKYWKGKLIVFVIEIKNKCWINNSNFSIFIAFETAVMRSRAERSEKKQHFNGNHKNNDYDDDTDITAKIENTRWQ